MRGHFNAEGLFEFLGRMSGFRTSEPFSPEHEPARNEANISRDILILRRSTRFCQNLRVFERGRGRNDGQQRERSGVDGLGVAHGYEMSGISSK